MRYVKDAPEPKVVQELRKPDDDFRILPQRVQNHIIESLVSRKRIAKPEPGVAPLLKFHVIGTRAIPDGMTIQDVSVHSRITTNGESRKHETRFRIRSDGKIETI